MRVDFRPERADFRLEKAWGMDGWTDGWTNGQMDGQTAGISPHSTGFFPLWELLPCFPEEDLVL